MDSKWLRLEIGAVVAFAITGVGAVTSEVLLRIVESGAAWRALVELLLATGAIVFAREALRQAPAMPAVRISSNLALGLLFSFVVVNFTKELGSLEGILLLGRGGANLVAQKFLGAAMVCALFTSCFYLMCFQTLRQVGAARASSSLPFADSLGQPFYAVFTVVLVVAYGSVQLAISLAEESGIISPLVEEVLLFLLSIGLLVPVVGVSRMLRSSRWAKVSLYLGAASFLLYRGIGLSFDVPALEQIGLRDNPISVQIFHLCGVGLICFPFVAVFLSIRALRVSGSDTLSGGTSGAENPTPGSSPSDSLGVETLTAGLLHELSNPLGAIMLTLDTATQSGDLPVRTVVALNAIKRESERCRRVLENVARFTRGEALTKSSQSIESVLRDAAGERLSAAAAETLPEIDICTTADLPQIMGNSTALEQVFVNLIVNAARSEARVVRVRATLVSEEAGPRVRVEIEDDGRGMAPETRRRAFDPFFTTWSAKGGTGLGLLLARKIIADHDGTLSLESTLGEGTTVTVELPVAKAP